MRLAALLLFASLTCGLAFGQVRIDSIPTIHERTISHGGKEYVVVYRVCDTCTMSVPATYPAGQAHYPAEISVFEQRGLDRIAVFKPWDGQWTADGCFEDDPKTLVEAALKESKK